MTITTQYYEQLSYVRLSGNLTANEVLGNVIKFNRGDEFKQIKVRFIDGRALQNVAFDGNKMKAFVAADKSAFLDNEDLTVIMLATQPCTFHCFPCIET